MPYQKMVVSAIKEQRYASGLAHSDPLGGRQHALSSLAPAGFSHGWLVS